MSNLILASASPRRVELLKKIVSDFVIVPADIDETLQKNESATAATRRLALAKARKSHVAGATTLAADTLVELDGLVFGKPYDRDEAREMLFALSNQTHAVVTSWCAKTDADEYVETDIAHVTFRMLAFNELESYLAMTDPTSYAGAYAIQGYGKHFIEAVEGDYETVVGLPTARVAATLAQVHLR